MFTKKFIIAIVLVVVLVLAVGVWLGSRLLTAQNPEGESDYSAVYLTTGDIYFGKLDWFPLPHLKNVWFLQRSVDQQNQTQLGVSPLNSAFWGPVDEVYLNPKEIVFWTHLRNNSQLAQALANPSALTGQTQQQGQLPISTSTFKGPLGQPPKY